MQPVIATKASTKNTAKMDTDVIGLNTEDDNDTKDEPPEDVEIDQDELEEVPTTNEKKSTWWYRPLMKFLGSYVGLFIILMIYISGGAYYFNQRLLNWIFFLDPLHSTSGLFLVHFRFTSGSLPVHLDPIDGRYPIIQFFKKKIAKFADILWTEKS